ALREVASRAEGDLLVLSRQVGDGHPEEESLMAPAREGDTPFGRKDRRTDFRPDRELPDTPCSDFDVREVSTERSVGNEQQTSVIERPGCGAAAYRLVRDQQP